MWLDELTKLRRYLRDPDGNIWSDAFLRNTWNDIQNDFQNRTKLLEEVVTQRVPDLYHCSYMYDWEWRNLPSKYSEFYQCLHKHDDKVFCHSWEPQEVTRIGSDTTDVGCHFTHPWEAFMGLTPGEEVRFKFPKNFSSVKYIAYDEEPILPTTRKHVQSIGTSHITREGRPQAYYEHESLDRSYVLYPRPSTSFIEEIDGEGVAFFVEDDSESADTGTIAVRTGSSETDNVGASVDVIGTKDNVLLVYDVAPKELETISDEPDVPAFLTKYVRFGVLERAYSANTDGRIPSLAALWGARYELGIRLVGQFQRKRLQDRDFRLRTKPSANIRRRRTPRLPDTYPAV